MSNHNGGGVTVRHEIMPAKHKYYKHYSGGDDMQRENEHHHSGSRFSKLYLSPEAPVAGALRYTFGNPTPIALGGFLLANTPACVQLMGWAGSGEGIGNLSSGIGTYYYLGGFLLYFGGLGEWILGNTFPATVFFTFGGYFMSFAATLTPSYNAKSAYADPAAFASGFAFFLVFISLICLLFLIAALRTNLCFVIILALSTCSFPCLAASFFYTAQGMTEVAKTTRVVGAAFGFAASMVAWYQFFSLVLESVDFPVTLPVGDLSKHFKGKSEREKGVREMA